MLSHSSQIKGGIYGVDTSEVTSTNIRERKAEMIMSLLGDYMNKPPRHRKELHEYAPSPFMGDRLLR